MLTGKKLALAGLSLLLAAILALAAAGAGAWFYLVPRLPSIETLREVKLQTPLRVFSADGRLIAEYGEQNRVVLRYEQIPPLMIKAVLAAEDDRFFEHPGVDIRGILRAALALLRTGEKSQGGSTITMQVARNFFLGREKTYLRKINEILLALKIERELSKEEILELYLNKIYFGNRAYGVGAAARAYYGKDLDQLTLSQMAMIAGLPKAPSIYNPIANPQRALARRNYALQRMHALGSIDTATYRKAVAEPDQARRYKSSAEVEAAYAGEMVRQEMVRRFGKEAYSAGYRVFTTIDSRLQKAADRALRNGLLSYIRRHGYPGPERHLEIPAAELLRWLRDTENRLAPPPTVAEALRAIQQIPVLGGLHPALVVQLSKHHLTAWLAADQQLVRLSRSGLIWALEQGTERGPKGISDLWRIGDVIRLRNLEGDRWELAALPQTEGALVSLDPNSGAITALSGGFDFFHSKFNRVTQAERQPGSAFKPFIYSAALSRGYTAASIINDAPVVMDDDNLDETWKPRNYSGRFFGPTRLRVALTKSRNLVSIRLLRNIGVGYAANYAARFGFRSENLPRDLSLALGSGSVTPLELATGYAVFANGGFLISPYLIERIEDAEGRLLWRAEPLRACPACDTAGGDSLMETSTTGEESPAFAKRVITPQNAYLMTSMMRDVIRRGTGYRAMELGRTDLAGKTGTTNDQFDAWFSGFNHAVVATVWTGFDIPRPMGNGESGARAALPVWMEFMRTALEGVPEIPLQQPPGMVTVRIDPENGLLANASSPSTIFETFRSEHVPAEQPETFWESSEENSRGLSELF